LVKDGVQAITTELEKGTADLPPLASAGKLRYTGRENTKALPRETGGAAAVWKGRTTMPDITAVTHAQNIRYDRKAEALYIIDQTLLPGEEKEIRLQTIDEMVEAIRALRVRGAPAIGICAAYCMYVLAKSIRTEDRPTFLKRLSDYGQQLDAARPTAVNLGWAIRDLDRGDRTQVVAFDSNVVSVGMLETGEVDALIVQNPYAMGYLGVETAANLINGQTGGPSVIDTATTIVTRENMYERESQKILFSFEERK
jgi:hypothetical protein